MLKIVVGGVAAVALGLFVLHGNGEGKTAKVTSCLEKAGATVQQSTYFEQVFATAADLRGEPMPEPFLNVVRELEKRLYDVRFADATAMLVFASSGGNAERLELDSIELGVPPSTVPPQRFGSVLVYWPEGPGATASTAVSDCLS